MLWEELNWAEFEKLVPKKYDTAILPVGTVEAHGVAPLGTDNLIPMELARRIADDLKGIIAPPVNHGITRTLLGYAGSLSVTPETFEKYLIELMITIADCGFKRLVILNGHGGNTKSLANAVREVWQARRIPIVSVDWWECCDDIVEKIYGRAGGHAATDENAAVQAFRPELIKKELYSDDMVYRQPPGFSIYPNPGTILSYKEGAGFLDFDQKKAEEYFAAVTERVKSHILDIFRRWDRL
ncbi:MAG TPA: creatininase [candidate division Zixibacteria bacterium]|nr:creatininase [candidate division Zixibacteria bacterium]